MLTGPYMMGSCDVGRWERRPPVRRVGAMCCIGCLRHCLLLLLLLLKAHTRLRHTASDEFHQAISAINDCGASSCQRGSAAQPK